MSVKWHPDDSEKILVAEKKGVIHMYNVVSVLMSPFDRFKKLDAKFSTFRHLNKLYYQWKQPNHR